MRLELDLAIRFLRRRAGRLLRGTALAAFAAVSLAVAALVVTLALMRGYADAIAGALQQGNAHMVGFAGRRMSASESGEIARRMLEVEGVRRATPVTYLSALIDDPTEATRPIPVTVKAVEQPPSYSGLEAWPATESTPAVLGSRLAARIGLAPGSTTVIQLPPESGSWIVPTLRLEVVGTFSLAFAEFDQEWLLVPLARVHRVMPDVGVAGVEVVLEDPMAVDRARIPLEDAFPMLYFSDWRQTDRSLFAALRWQTLSLFVVLSLVVAVAAFQVSSALVVLAIDKRRSAGTLQALGATPAVVRRVLLLSGLLLGSAGIVFGIAAGCLASWVLSAFDVVRFPEDLARVYMVDSIPFHVGWPDLLAVASVSVLLVAGASLWPAWRASREDPVAALRAV